MTPTTGALTIRALRPADREPIKSILESTDFFYKAEIDVALELVDVALTKPEQTDYFFGVAEAHGKVVGYVCYGAVAMAVGTYDLYWICVDQTQQRSGAGRKLMTWAEDRIAEAGGRLVIVETSGRPLYHPTRSFYLRIGYKEEARIRDFYAPGDDRVIYTKTVGQTLIG